MMALAGKARYTLANQTILVWLADSSLRIKICRSFAWTQRYICTHHCVSFCVCLMYVADWLNQQIVSNHIRTVCEWFGLQVGTPALVVLIIQIFMTNLNRKSNWSKNRPKKGRCTHWSMFYLRIILFLSSSPVESNSSLKNYPGLATGEGRITELRKQKKNRKIDHRKMKRSIIHDRKPMIWSKSWFLKTDQSIFNWNHYPDLYTLLSLLWKFHTTFLS